MREETFPLHLLIKTMQLIPLMQNDAT